MLALAPEELLAASERIGGLLLVELAKSLNWIAEGEFEDMEVILSVFWVLDFTGVSAWDGVMMKVELVPNTSISRLKIYCRMGICQKSFKKLYLFSVGNKTVIFQDKSQLSTSIHSQKLNPFSYLSYKVGEN